MLHVWDCVKIKNDNLQSITFAVFLWFIKWLAGKNPSGFLFAFSLVVHLKKQIPVLKQTATHIGSALVCLLSSLLFAMMYRRKKIQ